jgi:hypothetical protein
MKRVRSHYHALQVLKTANRRLRKAIISNCNKELLNVLNGNLPCNTGKLRKHKAALRKVIDRHVPLSLKKRLIVQRGGFLLPLLSAKLPTLSVLLTRS